MGKKTPSKAGAVTPCLPFLLTRDLVQEVEQLALFSPEGKGKAVWGTCLLLFCPPNSLFFTKPRLKLGCTTSCGGHTQTHTQTEAWDLLLYMLKEPHWLWKGLRGGITLCEGMLGPTSYTADGGMMTG